MSFKNEGGTIIIDGERDTRLARLMILKGALKLEVKGMKMSRGVSAYATVKQEFKLTGTKASVLVQFEKLLETMKAERLAEKPETPA